MYHGHMCTGKYSLMYAATIVSADLSGMGNASGHPVRWSIIVNMCLLPDVDVSHSVTRSTAIFIKQSIWYFCHLQRVVLNFGFFSLAKYAVHNVLPNVLIHPFPIILSLY